MSPSQATPLGGSRGVLPAAAHEGYLRHWLMFRCLDHYLEDRIWRWLMQKHKGLRRKRSSLRRLPSLVRPKWKVSREQRTEQFLLTSLSIQRFRPAAQPGYANLNRWWVSSVRTPVSEWPSPPRS